MAVVARSTRPTLLHFTVYLADGTAIRDAATPADIGTVLDTLVTRGATCILRGWYPTDADRAASAIAARAVTA
jgi:hypothetical protein